MPAYIAIIIGSVIGLAATIVACIMLLSENKAKKLNNFWYKIHQLINFQILIVDKILKFLYILSTCIVFCTGFFMLFSMTAYGQWNGLSGLGMMILGPIVIRITYELLMMFIILVENTIAIRNKVTGKEEKGTDETVAEEIPAEYVFCTKCGTRYDKNKGDCPNCGGEKKEDKVLDSITK